MNPDFLYIRPSHTGIPPNRDFRRSAASSLAASARHAARRGAKSPAPEHAKEWVKVWCREHEASGHARARRDRLFAICAKMHICAPPPARSRRPTHRRRALPPRTHQRAHTRALWPCARRYVGGRSGGLSTSPNRSGAAIGLHAVEGRLEARSQSNNLSRPGVLCAQRMAKGGHPSIEKCRHGSV